MSTHGITGLGILQVRARAHCRAPNTVIVAFRKAALRDVVPEPADVFKSSSRPSVAKEFELAT
jgi:hypothetical protein